MIHDLDREELALLKFSKEETETRLKWKHSREFEYNGSMYDIVETEVREDSIIYWCWWDHKETKLNKQLAQLVSIALNGSPQNQNQKWQIQQIIKTLYYDKQVIEISSEDIIFQDSNTPYCFSIKQCNPQQHSPPPQLS